MSRPRHARITATGRYVPDRVVANAELEELLGEPVDQWLVANVGIRERHVMAADETTSDLAVGAARACLRRVGRSPAELDLVIVPPTRPTTSARRPPRCCRPSSARAGRPPSTSTAPVPPG